jgi:sugar/nucleoside kinase (ribokinase family)
LEVAVVLARHARQLGISVSVDPERDRHSSDQDKLMELATTLFLNAHQMQDYFPPTTRPTPTHEHPTWLTKAIQPTLFYLRWYGDRQVNKEIVITMGDQGAIRVSTLKLEKACNNRNNNHNNNNKDDNNLWHPGNGCITNVAILDNDSDMSIMT